MYFKGLEILVSGQTLVSCLQDSRLKPQYCNKERREIERRDRQTDRHRKRDREIQRICKLSFRPNPLSLRKLRGEKKS